MRSAARSRRRSTAIASASDPTRAGGRGPSHARLSANQCLSVALRRRDAISTREALSARSAGCEIRVATKDMDGSSGERGGLLENAVLIAGPTASGKSAAALRIAQQLGGAIINTDSMQGYAVLDVLTARPSADHL